MQTDKRAGLGLIVGLGVALLVVFLVLTPGGGASGKARALLWTRVMLNGLQREGTNAAPFDYYQASDETRRKILGIGGQFHLLIKTNFSWSAETNRQIVVVSESALDGASQASPDKKPAHVAGYSDGTAGLISPGEFTNLDLTGFVSAASLAAGSKTSRAQE
jgi:hypothetical protein